MKAIVFLADGFEECEGLIAVDILRRAGVETIMASAMEGLQIDSSRHIKVMADAMAADIDYDTVREGMAAADVVFDPVDALFLEECARHGARCFNGIGMLVQQGALNFTLWTGEEAPVDVMYEALAKEIQG